MVNMNLYKYLNFERKKLFYYVQALPFHGYGSYKNFLIELF